ncbi:unnamed protein product [Linum tenue]|uniref:Uncharacterized protein n=1 Tax=Linum tenue TaxID=586396 RepID=A0AAV0RUC8_9ROSI|nr:unnamed protein product [Linum tenue]
MMSGHSRSDNDSPFDVDELLQIQTRCRELWKEKDMLRESQPQSFEFLRGLESHVKSLTGARAKDTRRIEMLERELLNCSQEIDYFQDQLSARNAEVFSLGKHVDELELKLVKVHDVEMKNHQLCDELERSKSENQLLIKELYSKEVELKRSSLVIKTLEESICSVTLDSLCEIEGMKLDMMVLEQPSFEVQKAQEEPIQENVSMNKLIKELEIQILNNQKAAEDLERENKELRDKLRASEISAQEYLQMIDKVLKPTCSKTGSSTKVSNEMSACGEVLGELFLKLPMLLEAEGDSKGQLNSMSCLINDYEAIVRNLKEELKELKLKAKEEAEDLAQEMAELRYETTSLLEEERKRRASIELASIQRIAELESQVQKEKRKLVAAIGHLNEA